MKNHKYEISEIDKMCNFIREHASIYYNEILKKPTLQSTKDVIKFIEVANFSKDTERFGLIYLNANLNIIDITFLFEGDIFECKLYPRKVIKNILDKNATNVIIFHNHPSGNTQPSDTDKNLTKKIQDACNIIDCSVLDHIIVGNPGEYFSFAEKGIL